MKIGCCKDCKDRKVTETYNCHSHCDRYLAAAMAKERVKQKIDKERRKEKLVDDVMIRGLERKRGTK